MIAMLDKTFKKEASEQAVRRMSQFNSFVRSSSEDVKSFWVRFSKLVEEVYSAGLAISPAMEYTRALSAMALPETQRMGILAAVITLGDPQDPVKLLEISIRLLHRPYTSEILIQQTDPMPGNEDWEEQVYIAKEKGEIAQGWGNQRFKERRG